MRYLIETCLTACEWIEQSRGKASAWKSRQEVEKKSILTFLSLGAVGGGVGYFFLVACTAVSQPSDWNFEYLVVLPILLAFGAVLGAITAFFVWLASALLKLRLKFVARAVIVVGVTILLGVAFCYVTEINAVEQWALSSIVGFVCIIDLPVIVMTGSRVRPCHLIFLGAAPHSTHHNFGSWLSFPVGSLLRVASIFGLLESLMALALWISNPSVDWSSFPAREQLPTIVFAIPYFASSVYFSFRTPRKFLLLPTVIILNVPLAARIVSLRNIAAPNSNALVYLLLGFICLWAVYTLGRLIAPQSVQPAIKSWRETMAKRVLPTHACQVQR